MVKVTRDVEVKGKQTHDVAYFLSDISVKSRTGLFNKCIRNHWGIESFHFTKDVTLKEDDWMVKDKDSAANYALLRNFVINIFRGQGAQCIQEFVEKCANNIPLMHDLIGFSA